ATREGTAEVAEIRAIARDERRHASWSRARHHGGTNVETLDEPPHVRLSRRARARVRRLLEREYRRPLCSLERCGRRFGGGWRRSGRLVARIVGRGRGHVRRRASGGGRAVRGSRQGDGYRL